MAYEFTPLGEIRTCFVDKFGIPRQPGLVPSAKGVIHLKRDANFEASVKGLTEFSHLWLIFVFHETESNGWRATVRPPRLGGLERVGVLASRSPHRPNPIGISVVKLVSVEIVRKEILITVSGVDLLDRTPILDLKPYIPYADSIPKARSGWAKEKLIPTKVKWSKKALADLKAVLQEHPEFKSLALEILQQDPRPAFQKRKLGATGSFGFRLYDWDVKWKPEGTYFLVLEIVPYVYQKVSNTF